MEWEGERESARQREKEREMEKWWRKREVRVGEEDDGG